MKKFICIILTILCTLCIFPSCTQQNDKNVLIRVNEVTHSIFYAPFYVAIEKGYFEEQNITIELTNGGGADKSMTALLSNSADIGLMGPEAAMYVYLNGKQNYPKVFGQLTKRDGSFLISRTKDKNGRSFNIRTTKKFQEYFKLKGDIKALVQRLDAEQDLKNL